MNMKLVVALCCLLVAVQARPKTETESRCSLRCASSPAWNGFEAGRAYEYSLQQEILLSSELSRKQASRLQINSTARIEAHSDCEMQLTVQVTGSAAGNKVDPLNPSEAPDRVVAALRQPLRFAYENGKISQLCPSEAETRASLNIKRGILSQLQISAGQRGQSKQMEETDILGDCWTEYTPEGANTLLKTKDLSSCKLSHQAYPRAGVKTLSDEQSTEAQKIMKGSLKCRMQLQSDADILEQASCIEEQEHSIDGTSSGSKEYVRVKTTLKLKSQSDEITAVLGEIQQRTDLKHKHKTSKDCQDSQIWQEEGFFNRGSECNERQMPSTGKTSANYVQAAKKVLEELCTQTSDESVKRYSAQKYGELIKYMRGITEQKDFNDFFNWANGEFCRENKMVKTMIASAVPTVGTEQSVRLILDQIQNSKLNEQVQSNMLQRGIVHLQHPTTEILSDMLEFVKTRVNDELSASSTEDRYALAALAYKICQEQKDCENDATVKKVIDFFSDSLGESCSNFEADAENAFAALISIGNLGRVRGGARTLVQCAKNQKIQLVNRVFALQSLRRFASMTKEEISELISVLQNKQIDTELRIVAYQILAKVALTRKSQLVDAIEQILDNDSEDEQVQFYIFTHLKNQQKSARQLLSSVLSKTSIVKRMQKLSRREYSNNLAAKYNFAAIGQKAQVESNIIFSSKSAVPRYVNMNLTVINPSNGQSVNLLEAGIRMEGLEQIIEKFYDTLSQKFGSKKEQTRSKRSIGFELSESQRKLKQQEAEPRIDILLRKYGIQHKHVIIASTHLNTISELIKSDQMDGVMAMVKDQVYDSVKSLGHTAGTLNEAAVAIPTIAGFPILIKQETHYITNMRLKHSIKSPASDQFNTQIEFKPVAAVHTSRTFAIDAVFQRAGIESNTNVITDTGVRVTVQTKDKNEVDQYDKQFTFKVEPLQNKQSLADLKTDVSFFEHNAQKALVKTPMKMDRQATEVQKCSGEAFEKYTGLKVCVVGRYAQSSNILRSLRQTPGYYQLYLQKSADFSAFEATYRVLSQQGKKQVLVIVGDRKSADRQVKFNATLVAESGDQSGKATLVAELTNPLLPLRLDASVTNPSGNATFDAEVKIGKKIYKANGFSQISKADTQIQCDLFRVGFEKQRIQFALKNKFSGFSSIKLPKCQTELKLKTGQNVQFNLEFKLQEEQNMFNWEMAAKHQTEKSKVASLKYRLKLQKQQKETEQSFTALYDIEAQNQQEQNLIHNFQFRMIQKAAAEAKQYQVMASHNLQYGQHQSPLNFNTQIELKEVKQGDKMQITTGSGMLTHHTTGKPVTVKIDNVKIQIGAAEYQKVQLKNVQVYDVTFSLNNEGTDVDYKLELSHLPVARWTIKQQLFNFEASVKSKQGSEEKTSCVQVSHAANCAAGSIMQIAKLQYGNDMMLHLTHDLQRTDKEIQHELFLQDFFNNKLRVQNKATWPKQKSVTVETNVEWNNKKFVSANQMLELVSQDASQQLKMNANVEFKKSKYNMQSSTTISKETIDNGKRFIEQQLQVVSGDYSLQQSFFLLRKLLAAMKYQDQFVLSGPTPKQQLTMATDIDARSDSGDLCKFNLQKQDDKKVQFQYALNLKKQTSDAKVQQFNIEVAANENIIKSSISLKKDDLSELIIKSEDSMKYHNIDLQLQRDGKSNLQFGLKGQVMQQPINTQAKMTFATQGQTVKRQISFECESTKTKLALNYEKQPNKLQSQLSFNCDCWLAKVEDFETKFQLESNDKSLVMIDSSVMLKKQEKAAFQLNVEKKAMKVSLRTASSQFKEAEMQASWSQSQQEGFKQFNGEAKLVGFGRNVIIKESGKIRFVQNEQFYYNVAMDAKMELQGLEDLIQRKIMETEFLVAVKNDFQYEVVAKFLGDKKDQLIMAESKFNTDESDSIKFVTMLETNFQQKRRYSVQADFLKKSVTVRAEILDKEAFFTFSRSVQDSIQTIDTQARTNFFMEKDATPKTFSVKIVHPTVLNMDNILVSVDAQLPIKQLEKVNFHFENRDSSKVLVSVQNQGQIYKLLEGSLVKEATDGGPVIEGTFHTDLRLFSDDFQGVNLKVKLDYSKKQEVSITARSVEDNKPMFEAKLFNYETPQKVENIPEDKVSFGIVIKSESVLVYVARTDEESATVWQLSAQRREEQLVRGNLRFDEGKFQSGKVMFMGQEYTVSSPEPKTIEFTTGSEGSSAPAVRVVVSKLGQDSAFLMSNMRVQIEVEGEKNMIEWRQTTMGYELRFGDSSEPNELQVTLQVSEATRMRIVHQVKPENEEMTIFPGWKVSNPLNKYPFEFDLTVKSQGKFLEMQATCQDVQVSHDHDMTNFPRKLDISSQMKQATGESKWQLELSFEKIGADVTNLNLQSHLRDVYQLTVKKDRADFKINKVVEAKIQTDLQSEKKQVVVELSLPVLQIEEVMKLITTYEQEAEKHQITVSYEHGSSVQISTAVVASISPKMLMEISTDFATKEEIQLLNTAVRSFATELKIDIDTQNRRLTANVITSLKVNSADVSSMDLTLKNQQGYLPVTAEATFIGFIQGTAAYQLENADGSKSVSVTLSKVAGQRLKYDAQLQIAARKEQSLIRDFRLNVQTYQRLYVISKEQQESGKVVVEVYLDKNSQIGITTALKMNSDSEKPSLDLEIQLPTRTLQLDAELQRSARSYLLKTSFAYDAKKAPEKAIDFDLKVDYNANFHYAVEVNAPFLNEKVKVEVRRQLRQKGFELRTAFVNGETEVVAARLDVTSQRKVHNGADAAETIIILETTGASETVQSNMQMTVMSYESSEWYGQAHSGDLKVTMPSKSVDKRIKFEYRPMQLLAVACDHGSGLSIKRISNQRVQQVVVFGSNLKKEAFRLTVSIDKPRAVLDAELNAGMGSFTSISDLSATHFRPDQKLAGASAGITSQGKKAHVAVFVGQMPVEHQLNVEQAAEVPADIYFLSAGVRVTDESQLKYFSNWRFANTEKTNDAIEYLKEVLLENWNSPSAQSFGSTLIESAANVADQISANIDSGKIVDELMVINAEDLDRLNRFIERAVAADDFYLGSIGAGLQQIKETVQVVRDQMVQVARDVQQQVAELVADFDVSELIQQTVDYFAETLEQLQLFKIWSNFVEKFRQFCQVVDQVVRVCIEAADKALKRIYQIIFDRKSADSLMSLVSETMDSAYPVNYAISKAFDVYRRISKAAYEILSTMGGDFVESFIQPYVAGHIGDFGTFQKFYNDILLEARIWYDTGASVEERQSLTRVQIVADSLMSDKSRQNWQNFLKSVSLFRNGQFSEAMHQFLRTSSNAVTAWRPQCDEDCQNGEGFATIQGQVYSPIYISSLNPSSLKSALETTRTPLTVLRRCQVVFRSFFSNKKQLGSSLWNPIASLLAIKHRTAVIQGDNHLITFDGVSIMHSRPCNYIVAHDMQGGDFTVLQTYKKSSDGQPQRDQLLVKFGSIQVAISREGTFKINDEIQTLPVQKATSGRTVEAKRENRIVEAHFHSELRDILVLRCSPVTDSCVIKVHPLYHGKVSGLAGSNDGRKDNDIMTDSDSHMQFWTAGECMESGRSTVKQPLTDSDQCDLWFEEGKSSFDKCFSVIQPQPYMAMCRQYKRSGKDACKVAGLYVERCESEGLLINIPEKCVQCHWASGKNIDMESIVHKREDLRRLTQVVFVVENSRCAKEAISARGSDVNRLEYLAKLLSRITVDTENKIEFGLATVGSVAGRRGLRAISISEAGNQFGTYHNLRTALRRVMEQPSESLQELDTVRAISELRDQFEFDPLAQKHVVLISCEPCSMNSMNKSAIFNAAWTAIKDQMHLHVIRKGVVPQVTQATEWRSNLIGYTSMMAFFSDRMPEKVLSLAPMQASADCFTELAVKRPSFSENSVWRLENLTDNDSSSGTISTSVKTLRQLIQEVIKPLYRNPPCMKCDCSLYRLTAAVPRCRMVSCY